MQRLPSFAHGAVQAVYLAQTSGLRGGEFAFQ
jgi:hypothetical protein